LIIYLIKLELLGFEDGVRIRDCGVLRSLVLVLVITREIRQASSPTMRGHFGCIFKATGKYTTGVWWAFFLICA
jgi:hypothetical protein